MARTTIDVDVYPGISPEGVYASVYIGDSQDDPIQVEECWENILETEIEYATVPNAARPIVVSSATDGVKDLYDTVDMLRNLADRLEEKIKERPIFLRDKWTEATDPETGAGRPAEDFYVTYDEYLSSVLGYDGVK